MKVSLQAARVNAGLTQDEMAKKLGVSSRTIIKWESSPGKLKPFIILSYASVCGITVDDIFLPEQFAKSEITTE